MGIISFIVQGPDFYNDKMVSLQKEQVCLLKIIL
jgi:hypothetical protein